MKVHCDTTGLVRMEQNGSYFAASTVYRSTGIGGGGEFIILIIYGYKSLMRSLGDLNHVKVFFSELIYLYEVV